MKDLQDLFDLSPRCPMIPLCKRAVSIIDQGRIRVELADRMDWIYSDSYTLPMERYYKTIEVTTSRHVTTTHSLQPR